MTRRGRKSDPELRDAVVMTFLAPIELKYAIEDRAFYWHKSAGHVIRKILTEQLLKNKPEQTEQTEQTEEA